MLPECYQMEYAQIAKLMLTPGNNKETKDLN
jgi:hypothetical protein